MTECGPLRRSLVLLAALALVSLLAGSAWARADALAQMHDLLARGYYNSAAQLNGPNLVQRFPDDAEARLLYARALYFVGDLAGAQAQLDHANRLVGGSAPASHVHLGALLRFANGDATGAVRALQNAFLREPLYTHAMDWARVAWQAGMFDEALEAFTAAAATERGRREPWPHVGRGRILLALERTDEAIAAFDTAIVVFETFDTGDSRLPSPAYVEAWYRLGEAYESLGRLTEAEVSYKAARSADPNYGPAVQAIDRLTRRVD
jgi:tetratricopeptide (TPR) repeat protein